MIDFDEENDDRITKLWTETLTIQKSLQDVDLEISRNTEKVLELDMISKYITDHQARIFEKVGRLFIERSSLNSAELFVNNNLLSKNQSGFRPGDSTINQLLSITNDTACLRVLGVPSLVPKQKNAPKSS